jgi:hypothetical protein
VTFQRGGVILAVVALVCVLPSLTGCINGGGSGSAVAASPCDGSSRP